MTSMLGMENLGEFNFHHVDMKACFNTPTPIFTSPTYVALFFAPESGPDTFLSWRNKCSTKALAMCCSGGGEVSQELIRADSDFGLTPLTGYVSRWNPRIGSETAIFGLAPSSYHKNVQESKISVGCERHIFETFSCL